MLLLHPARPSPTCSGSRRRRHCCCRQEKPPRAVRPPLAGSPSEAARHCCRCSRWLQELNAWNEQYGTTGSKKGVANKRLSYYL